jgi:four helix bundle protein
MDALRNLDVWKRACRFSVEIYKATVGCRDRGFRDQVTRSALSIASNIAEGYERETTKERIRYLFIAKGSCGECWTQLLIGVEAGFLD